MSSREVGIQCWVVQRHTTNPPCPEPSSWLRPGFQVPVGATLSNHLDAVSQTHRGYQLLNSGLRDRKELHSSAALPVTFCERGPHVQNEPKAQMIPKVHSSPDTLCPFFETPQTWKDCFSPLFLTTQSSELYRTRPISRVIVPEYRLISN